MFFRKPKKAARVSPVEKLEDRRLMSATYGTNLIQNPGAESYSGNADGTNIITPAGWTASGYPTVIQYGNVYANKANVQKASNGGVAFFAGGPYSRSDDFFQTIDISSVAGAIDAGQVNFALSAAIGGKGTDNDTATVSVRFLDTSQNIISISSTPMLSRKQRGNRSKFLREGVNGTVPANAVFARSIFISKDMTALTTMDTQIIFRWF